MKKEGIAEYRSEVKRLKDVHCAFVGRVCRKLKEGGCDIRTICDITGLHESSVRAVIFKEEEGPKNEEAGAE